MGDNEFSLVRTFAVEMSKWFDSNQAPGLHPVSVRAAITKSADWAAYDHRPDVYSSIACLHARKILTPSESMGGGACGDN